jgi:tetratricopeptide (TPR) repeat protein
MNYYLSFVALTLLTISSYAQNDQRNYPSLSPLSKIFQQIGTTQVEVEYERPSVRKRKIFGELVPWNKVWRTGAGYCTKIRFSKHVIVEGQNVPAGYYSLFTIPSPESWIVILNKDTTLYGSSFYNSQLDVARFVVIPTRSERHYETLTIEIDLIPNNGRFYISWENTRISFDILTTTDEETMRFINEQVASNKGKDADLYAGAAEYLPYQGKDLYLALSLANKAMQLDKNSWAVNVRLKLYETLGYYDELIKNFEQEIDVTKKAKYESEKDRQAKIKELEATVARIRSKQ